MPLIQADRFRVILFYKELVEPVTVRRDVSPHEAFMVFMAYSTAAEKAPGYIDRVVITDTPDDQEMVVNFDWREGRGIIFPDAEMMEKIRHG